MRKTTLAAAAITMMILALAMTRDRWLPPSWNRDWHQSWLISSGVRPSPRETLLEDHRKRVEKIESDYRTLIEEQKELHAQLMERLRKIRESKRES